MFSHRFFVVFVAVGLFCVVLASTTGVSHADITFTDISAGLTGVYYSSVAWGDHDNDGDLDILLTGDTGPWYLSRVYRNDGAGVFTDITAGLPGMYTSSVAWGDYDNDGDLDILLTGDTASGPISGVYRNDGAGVFTDITAGLTGVSGSSVAWGDHDNDGDLDILLTGYTASGPISLVYRNDGAGVFTDITAGLPGAAFGSVAWGDYDSDGDLDILLAGEDASHNRMARVYRNDGAGVFTDITAGLPEVTDGPVAWGDYDNDGDLDILLTGYSDSGRLSRVYRNDGGGVFTDIAAGLPGVDRSSVAWGDYDNDGDLDILLTGKMASGWISRLYRSDGAPANTPPVAPSNLTALVAVPKVTLSWNASTDGQTPTAGLSYNLRIGTTPGGSEIMSSMADAVSGFRRVAELGNAQQQTSWTVTVPGGSYYWSVQAVDGAYAGSEFAAENIVERPADAPGIDGIVDVPNDQGLQVSLSWTRSGYDYLGSPTPIPEYAVYRKIDEGLRETPGHARSEVSAKNPGFYPPGDWHFITTVPACAEEEYAVVAPTLADSTISEGMYYTTFFVRALTGTPGFHFDSAPDSGYSVDNLEPAAPQDLAADYDGEAIVLDWDENLEADFNYYAIYRGTEEGFALDTPIGYSTTPTYADNDLPGPGEHWYKVTATDFAGNESDPSLPANASTTGVSETAQLPTVFFLGRAIPNPFNPVTEISYGIPVGAEPSRVVMNVYDPTGRKVTTLVDADQGPGIYRTVWDGRDHKGAEVASGVYFYRLVWQGKAETRRIVLLK